MKRRDHWLRRVALASFGAFLLSLGAAQAQDAEEAPHDGESFFVEMKCNVCHSVESRDIERITKSDRMAGPDLSNFAKAGQEKEWVALFLRQEVDREGTKHRKGFTGSDEELEAIVDWLLTLEEEPTNGGS